MPATVGFSSAASKLLQKRYLKRSWWLGCDGKAAEKWGCREVFVGSFAAGKEVKAGGGGI